MGKIVLASSNSGKLKEFQQLLAEFDVECIPQSDLHVPAVAETGLSFVENAIIKARNASRHTNLPAIADDSGLEVDVLNGQPGIYSARFAGPQASDADNNQKLLHELAQCNDSQREARFHCVLVYMRHENDPVPLIFQSSWQGRILSEESGSNGFGYDPLFFVPEKNCSSADLSPNIKNTISHRGKAMAKLLKYWKAN